MPVYNRRSSFSVRMRLLIWVVAFTHILSILPTPIQAQDHCEKTLLDALEKYETGHFRETIAQLQPCLPSENTEVYALLARAYIADDRMDLAEDMVEELLALSPNYEPNTPKDPRFEDLVRRLRRSPSSAKKWLLAAVIAAAGIAAALIDRSGDDDESDGRLPGPPSLP